MCLQMRSTFKLTLPELAPCEGTSVFIHTRPGTRAAAGTWQFGECPCQLEALNNKAGSILLKSEDNSGKEAARRVADTVAAGHGARAITHHASTAPRDSRAHLRYGPRLHCKFFHFLSITLNLWTCT